MQNAPLYASSNQMQRRDASLALAEHLPNMTWRPHETILDIGCGSGDVTASLLYPALPTSISLLHGVDSSLDMVNYASEHHTSENVKFGVMDIAEVKYPRNLFPDGFDKIFSLYCLHWIPDLPSTVRNIYDLLVEDGESLVIFLANNPIFRMYRIMSDNIKWAGYMKDVETFIPVYQDKTDPGAEFRSLLTKSGFSVQYCKAKEFSFTFPNKNMLLASIKSVNPFLKRIPTELQSSYLSDCVNTLLKLNTGSGSAGIVAR